jgi:hypothetical protein
MVEKVGTEPAACTEFLLYAAESPGSNAECSYRLSFPDSTQAPISSTDTSEDVLSLAVCPSSEAAGSLATSAIEYFLSVEGTVVEEDAGDGEEEEAVVVVV